MAEKLSTAQQTVIDRMAAGDALTRGVSSRRAYVGSGNTRRMVAFFNMNELQDRGLIERCDRIGQPFITWCLTDAGRALATVSAAPTADMPDELAVVSADTPIVFDKVSTPVNWTIEIEPRRTIELPDGHPFAAVGENGWLFAGEDNCKYVLWRDGPFYYIGTQQRNHGDLDAFEAFVLAQPPTAADTPDSYTITALEAANDGALWTLVARGEVEVTSPFGATLIKSHGRHRNMFEFTARDDANDSFPTALLYSDILTVHRQQPPTDTPPASYRAARGAFAWQEGDEPAEATIRRIRGGEPPAAYFMPDPRKALAELATLGEASRAGMVGDYLNTLEKERDALREQLDAAHTDSDVHADIAHKRLAEVNSLREQLAAVSTVSDVFMNGAATYQAERDALQAANAQLAARAERAEGESTMLKHDLEDCEGALLAILNQRGVSNFKVGDYHIYKTWNEKSASAARRRRTVADA